MEIVSTLEQFYMEQRKFERNISNDRNISNSY